MSGKKYNFRFQSYPNTIEQERRRHGWTIGALAERSGVSRSTMSALEIWAGGGIPTKQYMKNVSDTVAGMIADALQVAPEELFKHYTKAATEYVPRMKPFSSVEERDAAIVAAMQRVKWTALKMCDCLRCKDVWYEMDDIIATAYAKMVEVAEEAFTRGIAAGACFEAIACGAVKNEFLRIRKYHGFQCRKADLVSYEAYFTLYDPASSYRFEDHLDMREECRAAVKTLSPERRRDSYIQELMECVGL